ncbi:hypothetical protein Tco_1019847 [Tanacetum coccineum]|uniref:Uncharacterized protein n=1 Tax=Tanacetum coccineum TaxID=301880 RepID=A0ABQ5G082_9ASTR
MATRIRKRMLLPKRKAEKNSGVRMCQWVRGGISNRRKPLSPVDVSITRCWSNGVGSSLPPFSFVPTWGIHKRGRVTTPVGVPLSSLPWPCAMAHAHALCQFESLYDIRTIALQEVTRLCESLAEKDSLMATNAEQALRIKELEQKLKSVDEVHSSAVKDLESQLAQKDSALVYAERISGERLSENEGLRAQLAFAQKEKTDAIRKLLPTVVERLLQSHEYKQSLSVPFNFALQTGWGQGLAKGRSEKELHKIMIRMKNVKPVQDLLKLHPAPPLRDAPKGWVRVFAIAPKIVRAGKGCQFSKTTASRSFFKSKTGPSPQDPAPKHVSGGSKAPLSRKDLAFCDL